VPLLDPEHQMNIKLAIGGGFVVGAIFWAGATYNRMGNMEVALGEIKTAIVALNEVPILKMEIESLKGEVKQLEQDRYEDLLTPGGKKR
jgi:hypothetical protein